MAPARTNYDTSDDEDDGTAKLLAAIDYILTLPAELQTASDKGSKNGHTSRERKREHEDAQYQEFGEKIHQVNSSWATELYRNLATDDEVMAYLRNPSSGYDTKKGHWNSLDNVHQGEEDLRSSILTIVSSTIAHFYPHLEPGVSRSVIDSHDFLLPHDNGKHASCPSISIKATGPSFEVPRNAEKSDGLGYTNVTGAIDVTLDGANEDSLEQATRLSVYCRYLR